MNILDRRIREVMDILWQSGLMGEYDSKDHDLADAHAHLKKVLKEELLEKKELIGCKECLEIAPKVECTVCSAKISTDGYNAYKQELVERWGL